MYPNVPSYQANELGYAEPIFFLCNHESSIIGVIGVIIVICRRFL